MRMLGTLCVAAILMIPVGSTAQDASVEFNLFSYEGLVVSRHFTFDAGYTERFGIAVPADFEIGLPQRDDVDLIADGQPEGGAFVKFTYATASEPRQFVENMQIVRGSFPVESNAENPALARLQSIDALLRTQAFPAAVQGFTNAEIIGSRVTEINGLNSVELVGTYVDPSIGLMGLRIVGLPHPDQAESYFVVINVNLTLVPLAGPEAFAESLTGQALSSFAYR